MLQLLKMVLGPHVTLKLCSSFLFNWFHPLVSFELVIWPAHVFLAYEHKGRIVHSILFLFPISLLYSSPLRRIEFDSVSSLKGLHDFEWLWDFKDVKVLFLLVYTFRLLMGLKIFLYVHQIHNSSHHRNHAEFKD